MSSDGRKLYQVGDLFDLVNGFAFKSKDFTISGIPIIKIKNVKPSRMVFDDFSYVSREIADSAQKYRVLKGDILITMSGNRIDGSKETWVGKVAMFKEEKEFLLNQRVGILRPKRGVKVDIDYVSYLLSSDEYQVHFITSANSSGGQANISPSIIYETDIELPAYDTQRRIAAILTALDDKIELNRRMNQTLEAIAQAIFREWFVRFNFPGATGEMVETEVGEVPKGWRVGKVSDVCEVNQNSISKDDSFDWIDYVEISGVSQGTISNVTRYEFGEQPSRARRKLKHGDVVLSTVRPSRGSYFLAIKPASTTIVSTGFAVFTPTHAPYGFLYLFLTDDKKLEYYGHVADGGAYPAIRPELIMEMDLVIPDDETLTVFQEVIEPFFETISKNLEESQTLTQVRDRLLPKLMRGEVEVV